MKKKYLKEKGFLSSIFFLYKESFLFSPKMCDILENAFEDVYQEFKEHNALPASEDAQDIIRQFEFLKEFRKKTVEVQSAFVKYFADSIEYQPRCQGEENGFADFQKYRESRKDYSSD